jgi:hypothetical protein
MVYVRGCDDLPHQPSLPWFWQYKPPVTLVMPIKHQETFPVEFTGALSRQIVKDGVAVKYYRNSFTIDKTEYQVSSPDDLQGLTGTVMFVKSGELGPDGTTKIVRDAFSLVKISSITGLTNTVSRLRLEKDIESLKG